MDDDLTAEELEQAFHAMVAWDDGSERAGPHVARSTTFEYLGTIWLRTLQPLPLPDCRLWARRIVFVAADGRRIGDVA